MVKKALVLLAEGLEEIEAITIIDILRRADIDVVACSLEEKTVTGAHGIKIIADKSLDEFRDEVDAIILPGGMPGAEHLAGSQKLKELLQKMHKENKLIAAICASPAVVLNPAGILDGKKATVYPGMEKDFGKDIIFSQDKVVIDGNVITSRGPGTALLFSLAIVEKLVGKGVSEELKKRTLA